MKKFVAPLLALACAATAEAVTCGAGSYAPNVPEKWQKALDRELFMKPHPGQALPTNDWWTDKLLSRWGGSLWAYPARVRCDEHGGVTVDFPGEWNKDGTAMVAQERVRVSGKDFKPDAAVVEDWHDGDVVLLLEDGEKSLRVTLAHGSPFVWFEAKGMRPIVIVESDRETPDEAEERFGIWRGETKGTHWVSVASLPDPRDEARLAPYAAAIVRATRVDWRYDEKKADLVTTWSVTTEDLRGKAKSPVALQGFLPHHLKKTRPAFKTLEGLSYATPRGRLRLAAGNALDVVYPFPGMMPIWAAPRKPGRLPRLLADYAERGTFGADTYWGGKGLLQMGLAMMAARELGEKGTFRKAHDRLRETLENWLTWTPGEEKYYFAAVPKWGGLIGQDPSYGSEAFNDHHFHYGYFTYAGALLCLVDADFAKKFGPMLRLVAKDYANWERKDRRFPLFRTFDPWAGHSFAGGFGDANGNGQESSSEAMQGWGGLYLLGLALGDTEMRDAAIFGYVSEARAVAEYWFDRDRENIDYTKYRHPYNSNLTCHGVGWWTYFSGDPVWMHSIQWLPNTPALDYLSEDLKFAKWDYDQMWQTKQITGWEKELGDASLGNVVLSYLQRSDPKQAAEIFEKLAEADRGVAKNADTGHLTYWATHSHLDWGELDWSVRADYPCARAFTKDGRRTLMAFNAGSAARTVTFFDDSGRSVGTLKAAPGKLTVK